MPGIKRPEEIFSEITDDYKGIFADDLVSLILYGSGASHEYIPGKSDLNFLIVVSEDAIDRLESVIDIVARWNKRNVATPLFMTRSYIESSLDSYPLEFLNMQKNHKLIYGTDLLEDLSFQPSHIRLQCEREIKGKLLLLREKFLETKGKPRGIQELIKTSITAFISIFSGMLYLKGVEVPAKKEDIIKAASGEFSIDRDIFIKCLATKKSERGMSSSEIKDLFNSYLVEARRLWAIVDKLEIKNGGN